MKKIFCILFSVLVLCGCRSSAEREIEPISEAATEISSGNESESNYTVEFSRDDFVLFADKDKTKDAVIWLGMEKSYVYESMENFADYFEGIDTISYNTQAEFVDGESTDKQIEYTSLISYTGSREYLETEKGIRTAGLYDTASKPNSTAEEVINAYGLDPENEGIYIGDPTETNYTIALYFDIDNHNNVKRITSAKDSDIGDIARVSGADYFIKFMITEGQVTGIQMYRERPVDAK